MTVLLSLLLAGLLGASLQQPRDGARPAATGSSRISGVVLTDERTPQPVRRAVCAHQGSPHRRFQPRAKPSQGLAARLSSLGDGAIGG